MIRAYFNAPGYRAVRFDASPWFEMAGLNDIRRLVDKKWSGKPAEKAAKGVIEFDGYTELYDTLVWARTHDGIDGAPLEPEYHIDPADGLAWLAYNRPEVHEAILTEFGGDVAACERSKADWADPRDPDETTYLRCTEERPAYR
ncbi:hypothetical protein [Bradyrhizobium commune]|uniref:Uncharacterized protein n=1 Tax=Bradyrhizobium commune TaxID=83627 RepID=A0A7S9D2Y1_9BRAD|nr:hypothetical protein [Bradyrhizobium commune]QPF90233.1 hypothetical protein IC761_27565 [Bradyrhizobium commune]